MQMQRIIRAIYPAQCVGCDTPTEDDHGLCGACWSDTMFINGTICDRCGAPLLGESDEDNAQCDDCMRIARPWSQGRAVMAYGGVARRLVLSLKHGDWTDLVQPLSRWMVPKAEQLIQMDTVLVPVPLHWSRLLKRRYNQAAMLANVLAKLLDRGFCPDALIRPRPTIPLDRHSRADRFQALDGAIRPNPKRQQLIEERPVLLIDDVMTSGATLGACADACLAAGASRVDIVTLARVVKDA